MTPIALLPVFLIGFVGSVHCIGMCGGIVSALSVSRAAGKAFPVPVVVAGAAAPRQALTADAFLVTLHNAGRIGSYAMAGAIAGGLAQSLQGVSRMVALQSGAAWMANLMLVALGLYLMDAWRGLARVEALGQPLWRRLQPLTRRLLPMDTPGRALALGALWGWLPCGMVYSVLLTAMLSGSAVSGAAVMASFGLGTLPALFAAGLFGAQLRKGMQQPRVRQICGLVVLGFALLGMLRLAGGISPHWLAQVCVTPVPGAHP